jgi:CHAT domain-containing protein/prefoldin subunit 5
MTNCSSIKSLFPFLFIWSLAVPGSVLSKNKLIDLNSIELRFANNFIKSGDSAFNNGHYDSALVYYKSSFNSYDKSNVKLGTELSLFRIASVYQSCGQHDKMAEYFQQALRIDKNLKEKNRDGSILQDIRTIYNVYGEDIYKRAVGYYQSAIELSEKIENKEGMAPLCNNISQIYCAWKKYDDAVKYQQKGLEIHIKTGPQEAITNDLESLGDVYYTWAKYDKANECYGKALQINKELKREDRIANDLSNLAKSFQLKLEDDKAKDCYMSALSIYKKLNKKVEISATLKEIGDVCQSMEKYGNTVRYYREAMGIDQKLNDSSGYATDLKKIGEAYKACANANKMAKEYHERYRIDKIIPWAKDPGVKYEYIGQIYNPKKLLRISFDYFTKATEIYKKMGDDLTAAEYLIEIGYLYEKFGHVDEAIESFRQALEIYKKDDGITDSIILDFNSYLSKIFERDRQVPQLLMTLGSAYYYQKKYPLAIQFLSEAIDNIERQNKLMFSDDSIGREYFEMQLSTYQHLLTSYFRCNDVSSAFGIFELFRSKLLMKHLSSDTIDLFSTKKSSARFDSCGKLKLCTIDSLQKTIPQGKVVIAYVNVTSTNSLSWPFGDPINSSVNNRIIFFVSSDTIIGIEISDSNFTSTVIKRFPKLIKTAMNRIEALELTKQKLISNKDLIFAEKLYDKSNLYKVVALYQDLLTSRSNPMARGMKMKQSSSQAIAELPELSRGFYDLLIKPISHLIKEKASLIIVPDGPLGLIPFETFIDDSGKYLCEKYTITYIQSMSVLNKLRLRQYSKDRKSILAFGGAIYDCSNYRTDTSNYVNHGQQNDNGELTPKPNRNRSFKMKWNDLPMTMAEVESLHTLYSDARVYTSDSVAESNIKELSRSGQLTRYRIIHFATHALTSQGLPELSAIVFSQCAGTIKDEDGFLRMAEIEQLKIKADFVNLSACETGIGQVYVSEGVVGLTNAFLIAGANGISVSLWPVADESTAKFMVELYKTALLNGENYSDAIAQVKRRFATGEHGEKYQEPFYWAPFVYYGR